jgi:hypothetical protein
MWTEGIVPIILLQQVPTTAGRLFQRWGCWREWPGQVLLPNCLMFYGVLVFGKRMKFSYKRLISSFYSYLPIGNNSFHSWPKQWQLARRLLSFLSFVSTKKILFWYDLGGRAFPTQEAPKECPVFWRICDKLSLFMSPNTLARLPRLREPWGHSQLVASFPTWAPWRANFLSDIHGLWTIHASGVYVCLSPLIHPQIAMGTEMKQCRLLVYSIYILVCSDWQNQWYRTVMPLLPLK